MFLILLLFPLLINALNSSSSQPLNYCADCSIFKPMKKFGFTFIPDQSYVTDIKCSNPFWPKEWRKEVKKITNIPTSICSIFYGTIVLLGKRTKNGTEIKPGKPCQSFHDCHGDEVCGIDNEWNFKCFSYPFLDQLDMPYDLFDKLRPTPPKPEKGFTRSPFFYTGAMFYFIASQFFIVLAFYSCSPTFRTPLDDVINKPTDIDKKMPTSTGSQMSISDPMVVNTGSGASGTTTASSSTSNQFLKPQ